jgi:hypothetical protein
MASPLRNGVVGVFHFRRVPPISKNAAGDHLLDPTINIFFLSDFVQLPAILQIDFALGLASHRPLFTIALPRLVARGAD